GPGSGNPGELGYRRSSGPRPVERGACGLFQGWYGAQLDSAAANHRNDRRREGGAGELIAATIRMLTQQENDRLTRIGPGAPMGALMRRYWIPALFASQLPAPDCSPVRVKLLSERLVAFRDTHGRIGLLD